MNQSSSKQEQIDAIYQKGILKLEEISKRYKEEMDAYIEELRQEKIRSLEKDLQA